MRRACWPLLFVAVAVLPGCGAHHPTGQFPELRPAIDAPEGYTLSFRDGPDFYTWVLAEDAMAGRRQRSGVGIYFGLHPNLKVDEKTASQVKGQLCSREVTWWVERSDDPQDPWVRRDTIIDYEHGAGFQPILLHVWVWGATEEQVATLAGRLVDLRFVARGR